MQMPPLDNLSVLGNGNTADEVVQYSVSEVAGVCFAVLLFNRISVVGVGVKLNKIFFDQCNIKKLFRKTLLLYAST